MTTSPDNLTALHLAVLSGDWPRSMALLKEGSDPNQQDAHGRSAFLCFCANAHRWSGAKLVEGLRQFMDCGADPSLPQEEGFTAWHSLLARCPDLLEMWLPEVLRDERDIESWFTQPPRAGDRQLDPLYSFMPFACRAQFEHSLPSLRAMMQEKLLDKTVSPGRSSRAQRRI